MTAAFGLPDLLTQMMNDAPEEFDALQKIFEADVLVGAMRIRGGVARAEGDDRHGWISRAADDADRATRRIERIDNWRLTVNFRRRFNRRPRNQ